VTAGQFLDVDVELVVHNLLMTAHSWALKQWNLRSRFTLEQYTEAELAMLLRSIGAEPRKPTDTVSQ